MSDLSLFPRFATVTGDFLFEPVFPRPPQPSFVSLSQLLSYVNTNTDYSLIAPVNGQTVDVPDVPRLILNPAGTLATLTLRMPVAANKRTIRIGTRQRIDALTFSALGGRTVDWAVTELPQYGVVDLTLVDSLNAWVRI